MLCLYPEALVETTNCLILHFGGDPLYIETLRTAGLVFVHLFYIQIQIQLNWGPLSFIICSDYFLNYLLKQCKYTQPENILLTHN